MKKNMVKKTKQIEGGRVEIEISYRDDCNNGHNSFYVTGEIWSHKTSKSDRFLESCGCLHDELEKHFPEYAHLIKWHGMGENMPLYYVENTLYHARTKDHDGVEVGDPVGFDERIKFADYEITHTEPARGFFEYLKNVKSFGKIVNIAHKKMVATNTGINTQLKGLIANGIMRHLAKSPRLTNGCGN